MSTFKVEVVPAKLKKHPNADTLSVAEVKGWQCVVRTQDFEDVKLGAYIPLDSIVPDTPEFAFLSKYRKVKTIKLRGQLSQGVLIPAKPHWKLGDDVTQELGITKWEPIEPIVLRGENIAEPGAFHHYTNIENIKNYPNVFQEGEQVVVTEKIHGTNVRFGLIDGKFYVGSHRCTKRGPGQLSFFERMKKGCKRFLFKDYKERKEDLTIYWKAALKYDIESKLRDLAVTYEDAPNIILFGEIFGRVQDLRYGLENSFDLRVFDVSLNEKYLDYHSFRVCLESMNVSSLVVPIVAIGSYGSEMLSLADGPAFQGEHIREGVVIKSLREQTHPSIGRKILKVISDDYLLRKHGTENH